MDNRQTYEKVISRYLLSHDQPVLFLLQTYSIHMTLEQMVATTEILCYILQAVTADRQNSS